MSTRLTCRVILPLVGALALFVTAVGVPPLGTGRCQAHPAPLERQERIRRLPWLAGQWQWDWHGSAWAVTMHPDLSYEADPLFPCSVRYVGRWKVQRQQGQVVLTVTEWIDDGEQLRQDRVRVEQTYDLERCGNDPSCFGNGHGLTLGPRK